MHARTLAGVALLAAGLLVGCAGRGTDPAGGPTTSSAAPTTAEASPQDQVTAVVTELGTSADPGQCTELYTSRGLEVAVGSTDPAACREAVRTSEPADDVVVDQVVVDGAGATARVTSIGGGSAGLAQTLELVREGDRWKVDGVAGLAIADRAAVDAGVAQDLQVWGPQILPPDQLPCILEELEAVPDAEVVTALQSGGSSAHAADAISWCLALGVDSVALYQIVLYQLQVKGLSEEQAGCVAVESLSALVDLTVQELATSQEARDRLDQAMVDGAETQVCQQRGKAP